MNFESLFLEKSDVLKYRLYALLTEPRPSAWSIRELSTALGLKYPAAYRLFYEVLTSVAETASTDKLKTRLLAGRDLPLTLDQYRAKLVQRSISYQLVEYVMTAPSPSMESFCMRHYISIATASRRAAALRPIMAHFDIALKMKPLRLEGNELNMRFFLYMMYTVGLRGTAWSTASLPAYESPIGFVERTRATDLFAHLSRIRTGLRHPLAAHTNLTAFGEKAAQLGLQPQHFDTATDFLETSALTFFQLTRIFTVPTHYTYSQLMRTQLALANPWAYAIADPIRAFCFETPEIHANESLDLDVFRIITSFWVLQNDIGQPTLLFDDVPIPPRLKATLTGIIQNLPTTANYQPFHLNQARFVHLIGNRIARDAKRESGKAHLA